MQIRRILYPTDFSEATKVAANSACDLADKFGAELHVLHVLHDLTVLTIREKAVQVLAHAPENFLAPVPL